MYVKRLCYIKKGRTCVLQLCVETTGCWHTLQTQTLPHQAPRMLCATACNTQHNLKNCLHTGFAFTHTLVGWNLICRPTNISVDTIMRDLPWSLCVTVFERLPFIFANIVQPSITWKTDSIFLRQAIILRRLECFGLHQNRMSDSLSVSLSVVKPPNKKMWSGDTGVKECQERPTGPFWGTLLTQAQPRGSESKKKNREHSSEKVQESNHFWHNRDIL